MPLGTLSARWAWLSVAPRLYSAVVGVLLAAALSALRAVGVAGALGARGCCRRFAVGDARRAPHCRCHGVTPVPLATPGARRPAASATLVPRHRRRWWRAALTESRRPHCAADSAEGAQLLGPQHWSLAAGDSRQASVCRHRRASPAPPVALGGVRVSALGWVARVHAACEVKGDWWAGAVRAGVGWRAAVCAVEGAACVAERWRRRWCGCASWACASTCCNGTSVRF